MKKKEFISSVVSLSLSMLIIQSSSMGFSVYISAKLGAEQMGLYHLILSVYSFAVTVALSGVPLAATRLVSQTHIKKEQYSYMKSCLGAGLFFGMSSFAVVFVLSEEICSRMLSNAQMAIPLKILAVSLPFLSVSRVIRGYFMGMRKVSYITVSTMAEEFSFMFIVLQMMNISGTYNTGVKILSVATSASAICGCLFDLIMYIISVERKKAYSNARSSLKSVLNISVPVGAGSYLRSALTATENLLIPSALAKSGVSNALASYGTVKAMAMPIITFPYVFLQSFTSLLMPEISSRNTVNGKKSVHRATQASIKYTVVFSSAIAVFLLIFGKKLALSLYSDINAGIYITALALLTIPMYIDSVTDSVLKGLDQQVYCLKINIIDSALRVPVIYLILPHTGVFGYIAVLYGSELLNLALSMRRLKKIS